MTSKSSRGGRRYLPYAFTEQGIAMLSSVQTRPHGRTKTVSFLIRPKLLTEAVLPRVIHNVLEVPELIYP